MGNKKNKDKDLVSKEEHYEAILKNGVRVVVVALSTFLVALGVKWMVNRPIAVAKADLDEPTPVVDSESAGKIKEMNDAYLKENGIEYNDSLSTNGMRNEMFDLHHLERQTSEQGPVAPIDESVSQAEDDKKEDVVEQNVESKAETKTDAKAEDNAGPTYDGEPDPNAEPENAEPVEVVDDAPAQEANNAVETAEVQVEQAEEQAPETAEVIEEVAPTQQENVEVETATETNVENAQASETVESQAEAPTQQAEEAPVATENQVKEQSPETAQPNAPVESEQVEEANAPSETVEQVEEASAPTVQAEKVEETNVETPTQQAEESNVTAENAEEAPSPAPTGDDAKTIESSTMDYYRNLQQGTSLTTDGAKTTSSGTNTLQSDSVHSVVGKYVRQNGVNTSGFTYQLDTTESKGGNLQKSSSFYTGLTGSIKDNGNKDLGVNVGFQHESINKNGLGVGYSLDGGVAVDNNLNVPLNAKVTGKVSNIPLGDKTALDLEAGIGVDSNNIAKNASVSADVGGKVSWGSSTQNGKTVNGTKTTSFGIDTLQRDTTHSIDGKYVRQNGVNTGGLMYQLTSTESKGGNLQKSSSFYAGLTGSINDSGSNKNLDANVGFRQKSVNKDGVVLGYSVDGGVSLDNNLNVPLNAKVTGNVSNISLGDSAVLDLEAGIGVDSNNIAKGASVSASVGGKISWGSSAQKRGNVSVDTQQQISNIINKSAQTNLGIKNVEQSNDNNNNNDNPTPDQQQDPLKPNPDHGEDFEEGTTTPTTPEQTPDTPTTPATPTTPEQTPSDDTTTPLTPNVEQGEEFSF